MLARRWRVGHQKTKSPVTHTTESVARAWACGDLRLADVRRQGDLVLATLTCAGERLRIDADDEETLPILSCIAVDFRDALKRNAYFHVRDGSLCFHDAVQTPKRRRGA